MNNLKVFVLLAGMVALFGLVGGMLGGQSGMLLALVIAAVMSGVMYFNSGKMALRAYRAQVVSREQAPEIYEIVDRLRQRAGLPMPQIAIAPHEQPNTFAAGAEISGKPLALASALDKLQMAAKRIPLSAFSAGIASLFSTHPPTEERIARLKAMARGGASTC